MSCTACDHSGKLTIPQRRADIIALLLCLLFVASGSLFLDRPGLQSDEALFTAAIYPPLPPYPAARVFGRDFPLMVMSYVGTLKSLLYTPIFAAFGVSAFSVRFPALIIGALSVWWFFRLLNATLGVRAALIGCALLATHSTYMWTVRLDWGPVALQHALFTGGCLAFVNYERTRRWIYALAGGVAFGLAMWDKALFAWSLAALSVSAFVVFSKHVRRALSFPALALALAGFVAGAYPLIRYNVRTNWTTFRENREPNTESYSYKLRILQHTADASVVGGPIIRPRFETPVRTPQGIAEQGIDFLAAVHGRVRTNAHLWLLLACVLTLPLGWGTSARRAVLFSLTFCALLWTQMIPLQNGGTSPHQIILLWPVALIPVAAVLQYVPGRWWITGAVSLQSLLVTFVWYSELLRYGGNAAWTEAIGSVAASLQSHRGRVCTLDWGFFDNLRAYGRGRYTMCVTEDPSNPEVQKYTLHDISDRDVIFIAHTSGHEIEAGRAIRIVDFARANGFRQTDRKLFHDANGRATIETFRLTKLQ